MPLYNFECENGHAREKYIHNANHRDDPIECEDCDVPMFRVASFGFGLTCFRENHGEWIQNIAPTPQFITSHGQWRETLKKHGREWVGASYGEKGCWV